MERESEIDRAGEVREKTQHMHSCNSRVALTDLAPLPPVAVTEWSMCGEWEWGKPGFVSHISMPWCAPGTERTKSDLASSASIPHPLQAFLSTQLETYSRSPRRTHSRKARKSASCQRRCMLPSYHSLVAAIQPIRSSFTE
jgi:hypothetical protein